MEKLEFQWDENKNKTNKQKHKVSFEEATAVFYDENALMRYDGAHSDEEERFIIIGANKVGKILLVCHCLRDSDRIIRIISARKADKEETNEYYES